MKYPEYIMKKVRQRIGLEPNDNSKDEEIVIMSPGEIIDAVLEWEGIIGYTEFIVDLVFDVYGFDKEN